MKAYHFTGDKLRDGSAIPPAGEWLIYNGLIKPCVSGLHASEHPMDALKYAPGPLLHLVELDGDLVSHGEPVDKWVGRRRMIIKSIDASETLRAFARWCALEVIHLWDAPEIVVAYLKTGNEDIREAARAVAKASARVAWAARVAYEATWAATWATAWTEAGDKEKQKQRDKFLEMVKLALGDIEEVEG